jgi:CRISPR-associated protein Csd1
MEATFGSRDMILQRLYELAERENLLEDPSVVTRQIACRVDFDPAGGFLGLHDLRERVEKPARGKAPAKFYMAGGRTLSVPGRPVVRDAQLNWKVTDPAAGGKEKPAVFLADTIARVLPVDRLIDEGQREKCASQRGTFWRFVRHVVSELQDPHLKSLIEFADQLETNAEIAERICAEVEASGLGTSDLCTLALSTDLGSCLLERPEIRRWWQNFFARDFATQQQSGRQGLCQVTRRETAIGNSVKTKIKGLVPIGCRADAYLVTGLDTANSFDLDGVEASMVSPEGIDGFTRALNALISNELRSGKSSYRVGRTMFLFWTAGTRSESFLTFLDPDPEQVTALLRSAAAGRQRSQSIDDDAFYLLTISANSARVVVRDYLETTIATVQQSLASWFRDLAVVDAQSDGVVVAASGFPLWQLAGSTAKEKDDQAPDIAGRLVMAAIHGNALPDSILRACLGRLCAEGNKGFTAVRMALIKLILIRKGIPMTETLNEDDIHPAYIYGRLLAVFEAIQYVALGNVNATVVDKFYGTFSAAPALVFSRLFANAQNHLRKIKGDNPGAFTVNDRRLSEIVALLPPAPPTGQLALKDQGRFALGYYHERARHFQKIAEHKARKAASNADPGSDD